MPLARRVFYGHFCIKASNAPVFEPFLHQGRRKYAYLWDFVQAGFPMPPVLSYFVRQDNRKYAYLWDFVEAGLRMPPVCGTFCTKVAESMHIYAVFPPRQQKATQMALRTPLEFYFEHFWPLLAKWLSGGLWSLILSTSIFCWPNGFQEPSGASF